jgi:hypothetical protein
MLTGQWTYRSYLNNPALVGSDPQKALADIFGEGVMTFDKVRRGVVKGVLDMGNGYFLDLRGTSTTLGGVTTVALRGFGRDGTPTAGWVYDYHGSPAYRWPKGVDQIPCLVGSILRAKPHNGEPAGVTACFIAINQG